MSESRKPGASTTVIHADRAHNPTRAVAPAIYQTTTYRWDEPDDGVDFAAEIAPSEFYARLGHPNAKQVEAVVAALEGADAALALGSGMAAATLSVLPFVRSGDHVLGGKTLYGGVAGLIRKWLPRYGVEGSVAAGHGVDDFAAAMRPNTRVVVIESPANPTLDCVDIAAVATLARERGARLVVDNTFATPVNTRPLALGAHAVFHSATKYLGGHSDVTAGVLASDADGVARAWETMTTLGPALGPFEAWLVLRGMRTLPLRVGRHNANGHALAAAMERMPGVSRVNYPGLPSHPSHAVALRQMSGFGGMLSVELAGGEAAAREFVGRLKLFTRATSLGGVESLVQFPASLSRMSESEQRAAGIAPGLVRVSVGCEDADDLIEDVRAALGG